MGDRVRRLLSSGKVVDITQYHPTLNLSNPLDRFTAPNMSSILDFIQPAMVRVTILHSDFPSSHPLGGEKRGTPSVDMREGLTVPNQYLASTLGQI